MPRAEARPIPRRRLRAHTVVMKTTSSSALAGSASHCEPFDSIVRERRATRHFTEEPVPEDELENILADAILAPSGFNLQPTRFLVLRDHANLEKLRAAAMDQAKITEAPVVVITWAPRYGWRDTIDRVFDESVRRGAMPAEGLAEKKKSAGTMIEKLTPAVWLNRHAMIAFTHLMLAAEAHGWDTAPMEGFDAAAVKKAFALPSDCEVIALLAIGRGTAPDSPFPGRLPMEMIVSVEQPDRPWRKEKVSD